MPRAPATSALGGNLPSLSAGNGPADGAPMSSPTMPGLSASPVGAASGASGSDRAPGGGSGTGGAGNSGSGVQGRLGTGAVGMLLVMVRLRLARRADSKPIWRSYLPEVPPA